jgi:hypothetical protein
MSIGSQFLARLQEGKAPAKKTEGYQFDRQVEAMKRALRDIGGKNDFADKIAEVFGMVGVPGMYLNKAEVRESVIEAATALRSKPARVTSFLALHSALKNFHGVLALRSAPKKPRGVLAEKKGDEVDLEGNTFQQLVEEVLVSLGMPVEMVTSAAKPGVKSPLRKKIAQLRADTAVRAAFVTFARLSGVKVNDGEVGMKKPAAKASDKKMFGEEVDNPAASNAPVKIDAGQTAFLEAAKGICEAFGVPPVTLALPRITQMMRRAAVKDAANGIAKGLMSKLLVQLHKRD